MSLAAEPIPEQTVAVVICAYTEQRWDDLRAAVASVLAQTYAADEIVVVVDHNELLLARARHEWSGVVRVTTNDRSRGLSGARNAGLASTDADIVAFLDDDATAEPDWLRLLIGAFDAPDVVAAGGAVVPEGSVPTWWPVEFNWVIGCSWPGLPESDGPVRNVIGCSMALRRDATEAAGGFADGIGRVGAVPTGCEETDLCIRLRAAGGEVEYRPASVVRHRVAPHRVTTRYFLHRCWAEGRSKAAVTRRNGVGSGLRSERSYVGRILPRAIVVAIVSGRPRRAAAIVAGLVTTSMGYLVGSIGGRP